MELSPGIRKVLLCLPISILLLVILAFFVFSHRDHPVDPTNPEEAAEGKVKHPGSSTTTDSPPVDGPIKKDDKKSKSATKGTPLLSGRVLGPKNKPIHGAKITVRYPEDAFGGFEDVARSRAMGTFNKKMTVLGKATSEENGHYVVEFPEIPETREYRVEARKKGYLPREETWFYSGSPSTLDIHMVRGDDGGLSIEGMVVDRSGAPIAKARVEAERDDGIRDGPWDRGGEEVDRRNTDAEGHFKLDVMSGAFRITAHAKGYARKSLSGVEAGSQEVRIELGPARNLTGRVIDTAGNPVASAALTIYSQNEASAEPPARLVRLLKDAAASAESEADGTFILEDLSMDSYLLEVRKSGFEVAKRLGRTAEGESPPIEIKLKPGGLLTGTVANAAGAPVAGAMVCLRDEAVRSKGQVARWLRESERELGAVRREKPKGKDKSAAAGAADQPDHPVSLSQADFVTSTDASGKFRVDTIRASVYTLSVDSEHYLPYVKDGLEVGSNSQVSVVLSSGITLRGKIVEKPGGGPVARATLWIETGVGRRSGQADAEGKFEIHGITAGPIHEVRIRAPGHSLLRKEGLEILPAPGVQEHDFELELTGSLAGKVLSMAGQPVANALVQTVGADRDAEGDEVQVKRLEATRLLRQTERSCRTSSDGSFQMSDVNAGPSVQVIVNHPDYQVLFSDPIPVKPGAELTGLVYRLRSGGKLTVLVLRPDRTPCPAAKVQAHHLRNGHITVSGDLVDRKGDKFSLATSAEGKAVFSGLEAGDYSVVVTASGYQTYRQPYLDVLEDDGGSLTVELLPESILAGTVHDSAGSAVEGAALRVTEGEERAPDQKSRPREQTLVRAMSQTDGSFRLTGLGDGPYHVETTAGGFADLSLDDVPVDRPLDVRLQRLGSIEGTVQIAETGALVDTFNVVLRRKGKKNETPADWKGTVKWGGSGSGSRQLEFENAGGDFVLPDLEPGQYEVRVFAPDLSPKEVPVRVSEGARARAAFLLYEGIVVSGQVMSIARNQPVEGALVMVLPAPEILSTVEKKKGLAAAGDPKPPVPRGRPVGDPVNTDENGSFGIRDIPAGKYVLVVYHPDYVETQQPFEIKAEGLTRDLPVKLDSGETLSGTVQNSSGVPLSGAIVTVKDSAGLTRHSLPTGVDGKYEIHGLTLGPYTLSVKLAGETEPSFEATVTIKKGENNFKARIKQ